MPGQLEIETYEVCRGTGPGDPQLVILTTDLATAAAAEEVRAFHDRLRAEGKVDPTPYQNPAVTIFTRPKPGGSTLPTAGTGDPAGLQRDLADFRGELVLYARQVVAGGDVYVRYGTTVHGHGVAIAGRVRGAPARRGPPG